MGIHITIFILISTIIYTLAFHYMLYRKIKDLHRDVICYEDQIREGIESLEKKIYSQEFDVCEVKEDFKDLQNKILDFDKKVRFFPMAKVTELRNIQC